MRGGASDHSGYRGDYRAPGTDQFRYDNPPLTVDSSVDDGDLNLGSDQYRPIPQQLRGSTAQDQNTRTGLLQEDDSDEKLLEV